MAVEEVGTGVGYVGRSSKASRVLFRRRGKAGDDEKGSKAGSSDDCCFFDTGVGDAARSAEEEAMV